MRAGARVVTSPTGRWPGRVAQTSECHGVPAEISMILGRTPTWAASGLLGGASSTRRSPTWDQRVPPDSPARFSMLNWVELLAPAPVSRGLGGAVAISTGPDLGTARLASRLSCRVFESREANRGGGASGFASREGGNTGLSGNDLRLTPEWEPGDLSRPKGKMVRLMFTLQSAKLYAFRFTTSGGRTGVPFQHNSAPISTE